MAKNLKDVILQRVARHYLNKQRRAYVGHYPQVVGYAFDFISQSINLYGRYEKTELDFITHELKDYLGSEKTVLDIGANIGNHSLAFANAFKNVVSFEPHPSTFQLLKLNARDYPNISPYMAGASNEHKKVTAISPLDNLGAPQS